MKNTDLQFYRSRALSAAKDFEYGTDVLKRLRDAKTEDEITTIMKEARHKKWND